MIGKAGSIDVRTDRRGRREDPTAWSATSTRGAIATAHHLATDAGQEMFEQGGNAVDAAVAAAYALGVCEPAASGLGGMGMAVLYHRGLRWTQMLDGACRAPVAATPEAVKASHRYRGHRAVAVPTAPALLERLRDRYGTLPRAVVMEPAIRIAKNGFATTPLLHQLISTYAGTLRKHNAGRLFLDEAGEPVPVGHVVRQPELAATLDRLAQEGTADFYTGEIGRQICRDMRRHDGFVGWDDLSSVPWPRESRPIWVPYGAHQLCTAGPPAGGLALAQLARMWTEVSAELDPDDPGGAVWMAAMIRRARQDRQRYRLQVGARDLGDAAELLSTEHTASAVQSLHADLEGGETSHISAMDEETAISLTVSIERSFGSACIAEGLGFLYNGYLRGFKVEATTHPHYLRPGAPARSNAAPALVFDARGPWAAIGSTGSERMASSIFMTLARLKQLSPFGAVAAPRLHCTPDGNLLIEGERFPARTVRALRKHFDVNDVGPYSFRMGGLQLVVRTGGTWTGVADPRRDGAAAAV